MEPLPMNPLHGEVHGSIIKLNSDPGLADGQHVEVTVRPTSTVDIEAARKRLLSFKGVPDWSDKDDEILAEIQESRSLWRDPIDDDTVE